MQVPAKSLLERTRRLARDGLKSDADLPAVDEARPYGDPVLSRVQRGPGAPRGRREGRNPGRLALLQALQPPLRDQGRDPRPVAAGFQMTPRSPDSPLGAAKPGGHSRRERLSVPRAMARAHL